MLYFYLTPPWNSSTAAVIGTADFDATLMFLHKQYSVDGKDTIFKSLQKYPCWRLVGPALWYWAECRDTGDMTNKSVLALEPSKGFEKRYENVNWHGVCNSKEVYDISSLAFRDLAEQ